MLNAECRSQKSEGGTSGPASVRIAGMTLVNGQVQVDAAELGPAVEKLLDLLAERRAPIWISRDGQPLAEVLPAGELALVSPQLQVKFNVSPSSLTTTDDWREAGL